MSTIIFDTSTLDDRLCRVDPGGDLIDLISASYVGESAAIIEQVIRLRQCDPNVVQRKISRPITVTDEELAEFIVLTAANVPHLDRVLEDPYDLVLLAYHKINDAKLLISCDRYLLYVAEYLELTHRCFKAALHDANACLDSGITEDPAYHTDDMFQNGTDPFFNYPNNRYCTICDRHRQCACHHQ